MKLVSSSLRCLARFGLLGLMTFGAFPSAHASLIFEAPFDHWGTVHGGTLTESTRRNDGTVTLETANPLGVASGGYVNVTRTRGGKDLFHIGDVTPTGPASSLGALFSVGEEWVSFQGGLDFYYRINSISNPSYNNWMRPIDLGGPVQPGEIRMILHSLTASTLRFHLLGEAGTSAFTNAKGQPVSEIIFDTAYADLSTVGVVNHIGLTFETDADTGWITVRSFAQKGQDGIATSGTPLGSVQFKINSDVVTKGLSTGGWSLGAGHGNYEDALYSIDYDSLRIYNAVPESFAAIPEPGQLGLALIGGVACLVFYRRYRVKP